MSTFFFFIIYWNPISICTLASQDLNPALHSLHCSYVHRMTFRVREEHS